MKQDLIKHGIVEHKTLVLKPPNITDDLIKHYIRGYFDGDGSWSYNSNSNQYQFKVVGTKGVLNFIQDHLGYGHLKIYKRRKEHVNTFYTSIGGNKQVLNIMKYLYDDSHIYLERKYEKYKHLSTQSH